MARGPTGTRLERRTRWLGSGCPDVLAIVDTEAVPPEQARAGKLCDHWPVISRA
jgi:hypothetical protein